MESFRDAIETIANLRRAPLGYRLDSTFLVDKQELYSQAIKEALRAEAVWDCCQFMESIKSRTLTAVLSIPASRDQASSGLDAQFVDLTQQLDAREYQAYREGWNSQRKLEHRELLQQRADLLERIRISDPRWRYLTQPVQLDVKKLLQVLSQRSQAVLTLYYDPPDLSAVLLFNGQVQGDRLTISDEVARKLTDYAKYLQQVHYNPYKQDLSVDSGVKAEHLIPSSLLSQALQADSLVIIPQGLLHLIPWSGLVHDNFRLFERLPVGILPNLGLLSAAAVPSTPRCAALVGVPAYPGMEKLQELPSAREEIEAVRAIYEGMGIPALEPLLDDAATERAFWKSVRSLEGDSNVLHISCHATIVPNEPMNSGLLLFDSKVDAAELARARLPFAEVVLSACSTGWRPTQVGDVVLTADEILGIPAGFLESGVSSVLVSIPKAEGQAARKLTTHYHQQRVAGDSPLRAVQSAQKQLLAQGVLPGTWVGFTLYGCI